MRNSRRNSAPSTRTGSSKAKTGEIDGLKQQVADLDRYGTLLADAADLKVAADAAEDLQKAARTAANTAKLNAESIVRKLDAHRKSVERAQGNENERVRLIARRGRLQQSLRHARDVERAQSLLAEARDSR